MRGIKNYIYPAVMVGIILMSTLPGLLESLFFPAVLIAIFIVIPVSVLIFSYYFYQIIRGRSSIKVNYRSISKYGMWSGIPLLLVYFKLPMTFIFLAHQSYFDEIASDKKQIYPDAIGIYSIQEARYAEDGNFYVVTKVNPDFVDQYSFGFVKGMIGERTPYGGADLKTIELNGGWYWFRANNDY